MKNVSFVAKAFLLFALFSLWTGQVFATGSNHTYNNGSITVCKMLVDDEGSVATSSQNLPSGTFSVTISKGGVATTSSSLQTVTFDASSFSPNKKIISGGNNDAQCVKIDGLDPNASYFYSEETVTGGSDWLSKKYNDQYSQSIASLNDFFSYSSELWDNNFGNDGSRNLNSDGHIILSHNRANRTLVILNTYKAPVPQPPTPTNVNIVAAKIVCDSESDLPNWSGTNTNISSTTASDFVANNQNCHLESGWKFQWGYGDKAGHHGVSGLTGTFIGEANGSQGANTNTGSAFNAWKTFGPTDQNGITSVQIGDLAGSPRIWVREVQKTGYVPFTYNYGNDAPGSNESAEMWCHTDVLNYDNYDFIDNPQLGQTYYCVALNAASSTPALPACSDNIDNDNDSRIDSQDPGCHSDGNQNNPGSYTPTDNNEENEIGICISRITPHGSDAPVTIKNSFSASEQTIDTVLYAAGYSVSTTTGQDPYSTWELTGNRTYSLDITLLASYANYKSVFGYYEKGNPSSFTPLFRTGDFPGMSATNTPVLSIGATTTVAISSPVEIGFAIVPFGEGAHNTLLATEKSLNSNDGNADHAIVFDLSDAFAIGFEDLLATGNSDQDFNDVVVLIQATSCNENPTPPTNTKPVITLLGANPINLTVGDTFTDPGATAFDVEDGSITGNIVKGGTVTTTIAGTYTLTYNVTDSGGLAANQVTRTVHVNLPPNPGSINVCKVIVDQVNTIATTSSNLPAGTFSIKLASTTDFATTTIQTITWGASTFSPNRNIILNGNDAQCVSVSNLSLGSYYYSEESISGTNAWATTTKYNDQDASSVNNVFDFFTYDDALFTATTTDDAGRSLNSDGQITLTSGNYERTLVVLNKYDTTVLPQCSDSQDNDGDSKIDTADPACHTDGIATSTVSYDPNLDNENSKPIITLIGGNPINLIVGENFTDPGATAHDDEDGDITGEIIATSTVNTDVAGSYTVSYNVTDSDGLAANEVTRTVSVTTGGSGGGGGDTPTPTVVSTGGGGGGGPIAGLFITNETVERVSSDSVLVKWNTNMFATRRVVYGENSVSSLGAEPLYGYATTTKEISDPLLTFHSVLITGIGQNKTFYFRPISKSGSYIANGKELTIAPGTPISAPSGAIGGTTAPTGGSCYYLFDFLKRGENNDPVEVRKLQVFLNAFEGESLGVNGTFDDATFDAVSRFQNKYFSDILAPWGHDASTGYVYILTKKKVNEIYCRTAFPVTALEQSEIDSFRAFLTSLREAGVIGEGETTVPPFGNVIPEEVEGGIIIPGEVGVVGPGAGSIGGSGTTTNGQGGGLRLRTPGFLANLAAAAFTLPENIPDALICLFTLLLTLVVIYVLSTIIVNSNTLGLPKHEVRTRKIGYFIAGTIIAFGGAIIFKIYCLIVPLLIVLLFLAVFLLLHNNKKDKNISITTTNVGGVKKYEAPKMEVKKEAIEVKKEVTEIKKEEKKQEPIILPGKTQNKTPQWPVLTKTPEQKKEEDKK